MLYSILKEKMLQYPNQIISNGIESLTYIELIEYAEALGDTLTNDKYGLLFNSDLDTAKALLACLYAKKTAVLLSKHYGAVYTERIIASARLSHLLTEEGAIQIDNNFNEPEDLSDVALIMYTSGTTGVPKGSMITYNNLKSNLMDISLYFQVDSTDHIFIVRPLFHCAVLTGELLISLFKGMQISFFSEGFVPTSILGNAKEIGATTLCGTPTLLYHLSKINLKLQNPLVLKNIVVSGECMTDVVAKVLRRAFPNSDIYNVYGLTEASPRVSYLPPEEFDSHPTSVGRPLSSVKVKVVDNELLVFGNSVMKGYYNDIDTTLYTKKNGWLHTGDIAEIDADGRIYIKCRKDDMIIRAGMNIYPKEIENALKEHELILEVLAFGVKNSIGSEQVHLKVVTTLSEAEVYNICKQKLRHYELPHVIDIVTELPKSASGKVIRRVGND